MDDTAIQIDKSTVVAEPATEGTIERLRVEESYRRGAGHGIGFCLGLLDRDETLGEARQMLAQAERLAGELRYRRANQDNLLFLDYIRGRLRWPKRQGVPR